MNQSMKWSAAAIVAMLAACGSGEPASNPPVPPQGNTCQDGTTMSCTCADGAAGMRTCNQGIWSACACDTACAADGRPCTAPTDCCSGACQSGTCGTGTTCTPDGRACTTNGDCCSGVCSEGTCGGGGGGCLPDGQPCTVDSECCTLVCWSDGYCGDPGGGGGGGCLADGQACTSDSECCSAICWTDGYCGDPGGGGAACEGDWTLGSTFYTCSNCGLGQTCNSVPPTNCIDGTWIEFGDGGCYCIAACGSFGLDIGESCTTDGLWTCQHIQATNASANHMLACVPSTWNVCTQDGGGGGGGTCLPDGQACTLDSDCCSAVCWSDGYCGDPGGGGSCLPDGQACTFDSDCCSAVCWSDGYCGDPGGTCAGEGQFCYYDEDCCSGICWSDNTCA